MDFHQILGMAIKHGIVDEILESMDFGLKLELVDNPAHPHTQQPVDMISKIKVGNHLWHTQLQ